MTTTKPANIFVPHDSYTIPNGATRVWAIWGGFTEVYIDLNADREVVGGTFVTGSIPSNELNYAALEYLNNM